MKKILFIVKGYYPDISASGNLIKPLVEELEKENCIYIISRSDKEEEIQISKNIIHKKIKINEKISKSKRIKNAIKNRVCLYNYDKYVVKKLKEEIEKMDKKLNFDFIMAITYDEIIALMECDIPKIKKRTYLLEKVQVNRLDSFKIMKSAKIKYREKIENKIINEYDKVYTLPIMYSYFKRKNKTKNIDKILQLEHPMIIDRVTKPKNMNEIKVQLIYAGGIDRYQRNPLKVIECFNKIDEKYPINIEFYAYGNMNDKLKEIDNIYNFFNLHGPVNKTKLDKIIEKNQIIITIGNKEDDIVPSKIFDCISTGKPIIHFSQIDNDPYYFYLKRYKNSLIIKFEELEKEETKSKIIEFIKKHKNTVIEFSQIKNEFKECTPEYIANQIIKNEA